MYRCVITQNSVTLAIKSSKILNDFAIASTVINIDKKSNPNGCAYGLSVSCRDVGNAENILGRYGIKYSVLRGMN